MKLQNKKMDELLIKAPCDGKLILNYEFDKGMQIPDKSQIGKVLPKDSEESYIVEIMIPSREIRYISDNMNVKIEFSELPSSDYGFIDSTITDISKVATVSEENGQSYYRAKCKIKSNLMYGIDGKEEQIKPEMMANTKIIKSKVSYMNYMLELINIK